MTRNVHESEKATPAIDGLLMIPPLITGHLFPSLSHFIVEGSPAPKIFCPAKETICPYWVIQVATANCQTPWVMENTPGCCLRLEKVPDENCVDKINLVAFLILSIMLFIFYFFAGLGVGWLIYLKKSKRKNSLY